MISTLIIIAVTDVATLVSIDTSPRDAPNSALGEIGELRV